MNLFKYTYNLVKQIPSGKVSTYGALANALGDITAARAVGRMMNQNPDPDDMPCFRIVYSDGRLGGFGRGIRDKIKRLRNDNIKVKNGRIIDFEKVLFTDFDTNYPLKKLRNEQINRTKEIILQNSFEKIDTIAGIDVSYPKNEFEEACGACIVLSYKNKEILEKKTIFSHTKFPYISTYLAYRELPVIKKLIKSISSKPTVYMFDGHGISHPHGLGLASHVGVEMDIPSIGIAKNLLYGKIINDTIYINDNARGKLLYSNDRVKNPVYISPGHKISLETSYKIVKKFSKYRIPEPIRLAHILAKKTLNYKS